MTENEIKMQIIYMTQQSKSLNTGEVFTPKQIEFMMRYTTFELLEIMQGAAFVQVLKLNDGDIQSLKFKLDPKVDFTGGGH